MSSSSDVGGGTPVPALDSTVMKFYSPNGWTTVCEETYNIHDGTAWRTASEGDRIYWSGKWLAISCGTVAVEKAEANSYSASSGYNTQTRFISLTVNGTEDFLGDFQLDLSVKQLNLQYTSVGPPDTWIEIDGTKWVDPGVGSKKSKVVDVNQATPVSTLPFGYIMEFHIGAFGAGGSETASWDVDVEFSYKITYKNRVIGSDVFTSNLKRIGQ